MRPTRVYPDKLHLYNKMLTRKIKMFCGTEITALHLLKETKQFYISISAWAFCVSTFKKLKSNTELKVNYPVLQNEKAKSFLKCHAWFDWVDKEKERKDSDTIETLNFLNRIFPDKKKVFFHELKNIVGAYCHGSFLKYDKNGNILKPTDFDINTRKYYTKKYYGEITGNDVKLPNEIIRQEYVNIKDKEKRNKIFDKYYKLEREYLYKNHNLTDIFIELGKNVIVCPYIYTHQCVKGSSYENAGEIYFIITDDTIYFQTERHF